MKSSFNLVVLLFCLITYGHGRPSNNDEHDEIIRESKKEKYFQQSRVEHRGYPDGVEDGVQTMPFYGGAKGKYLVIHPSGRTTVEDHRPPSYADSPKEDEEDVGQEGDGDSGSSASEEPPNESVSVNLPPDNASVAEAKPVGLAIAGVGGVASSKPVATAVVGPGGLALAKPVATAIAGIPGAEALVGVAGSSSKQKQKAAATSAPATSSHPSKATGSGGKSKRSAAAAAAVVRAPIGYYEGPPASPIWPTYPLYQIPESHMWGFILRPVYSGALAN